MESNGKIFGVWYVGIAVVLFVLGVVLGLLKKNILGRNFKLGVVNSMLLAVFWPVTISCILGGWTYECVQIWKKI